MKFKRTKKVDGLRIYRKICELVRIVEVKDDDGDIKTYLVQSRHNKHAEWKTIQDTISLKKAIQKKHFQILIAIRDLGYRQDFLRKRKLRRGY